MILLFAVHVPETIAGRKLAAGVDCLPDRLSIRSAGSGYRMESCHFAELPSVR